MPENRYVDVLTVCQDPGGFHEHVEGNVAERGCFADCECQPRAYVALDAVVDALNQHYLTTTVCGDFKQAIDVIRERFGNDR
jgi:hypothetical protein